MQKSEPGLCKNHNRVYVFVWFLAHLSTTCSMGAFRVVMCPSSTISLNIFSSQTARPIWTKLGRYVPWEVLFKNCSQNLIEFGCHGNEIEFFKQFFKNLLLWNRWSDFEIISQECFLGDPSKKVFAKFWSAQKHGSGEWGLLALWDMKKFLKNLLLRNCWSDFEIIS